MSSPSNNPTSSAKGVGTRFNCIHSVLPFIESNHKASEAVKFGPLIGTRLQVQTWKGSADSLCPRQQSNGKNSCFGPGRGDEKAIEKTAFYWLAGEGGS